MDAEFKNKKEVVFDGKDLIFNVDGIEIRNGKLPDSFSIKERYEISAESLTKLVVALGDGNTLAEFIDVQEGFSFSRKKTKRHNRNSSIRRKTSSMRTITHLNVGINWPNRKRRDLLVSSISFLPV